GALMFPIARAHVARVALVPDDAIATAQRRMWGAVRIVAEPGGTPALAALPSGAHVPPPPGRAGRGGGGGRTPPRRPLAAGGQAVGSRRRRGRSPAGLLRGVWGRLRQAGRPPLHRRRDSRAVRPQRGRHGAAGDAGLLAGRARGAARGVSASSRVLPARVSAS